jgi:hypothetical protein
MSATDPNPTATLPKIVNLPETVKAFGREYQISKFNLGQLAQALDYAGYIGVLVIQAMKLGTKPTQEDLISFITQGVAVSSPAFIPIISIATKEPIGWLEEQEDAVGALDIFVKAVVKNKDFFTQENIDRVKAIFAGLLPTDQTAGGKSSTISSPTGMDSAPS